MWRQCLGVPLAAVLLMACTDSPTNSEDRPVEIQNIVSSPYSGITVARQQAVRTTADWSRVWAEVHGNITPGPPIPFVDFGREVVLLAALGQRPDGCYSIAIPRVTYDGNRLLAQIVETTRTINCVCTLALTTPVHVVRVSPSGAPVVFDVSQASVPC